MDIHKTDEETCAEHENFTILVRNLHFGNISCIVKRSSTSFHKITNLLLLLASHSHFKRIYTFEARTKLFRFT